MKKLGLEGPGNLPEPAWDLGISPNHVWLSEIVQIKIGVDSSHDKLEGQLVSEKQGF